MSDRNTEISPSDGSGESRHPIGRAELHYILLRSTEIVQALDELRPGEWTECAEQFRNLSQRLEEASLVVAVLGQFKRGKSTLLNALLGADILPSALLPLTSIPTIIKYGKVNCVNVALIDGTSLTVSIQDLSLYVTERGNPRNRKGVAGVEVFCASPVLLKGIVFVDTPGIGSTLSHNTEVTRNFVPRCDCALIVLSADPPITEVELQFIEAVVPLLSLALYVVNKTDYLSRQGIQEIAGFLREALEEKKLCPYGDEIFSVSARIGLEGRKTGQDQLWAESGMEALEKRIETLLVSHREALLERSISLKAMALLHQLRCRLDLETKALELSMEDLEARIDALTLLEAKVKEERLWLRDALMAEQQRIASEIWERAGALRNEGITLLSRGVREVLRSAAPADRCHQLVGKLRNFIDEAVPGYFKDKKDAFIKASVELTEARCAKLLEKADDLVRKVREEAMAILEVKASPLAQEPLVLKWRTVLWNSSHKTYGLFEALKNLSYRVLPRSLLVKYLAQDALNEVEWLVLRNTGKLRYEVFESLERALKHINMRLIHELNQALQDTKKAVEGAMQMRGEKEHEVSSHLIKLKKFRDEINILS